MRIIIHDCAVVLPYSVTVLRELDLVRIDGEERIVSSTDFMRNDGEYVTIIRHRDIEGNDPRELEAPPGSALPYVGRVELKLD